MKSNTFKHRAYADFSKSQTWINHLKPDLEKIKLEASMSEADAQNEFDAIKRDVKRSNTNLIINRIIRIIEKAEERIK